MLQENTFPYHERFLLNKLAKLTLLFKQFFAIFTFPLFGFDIIFKEFTLLFDALI